MCKLTYFSLKNILNSTCIGRGSEGTVYVDNDQAYKFSNTFLQGSLFSPKPINYVNLDIIGYYNMVKNKVKFTNLPTQLIDYKRVTVGVIYPYYQNYKPFSQLYLENNDLFLTKLYELVRNNIELLENINSIGSCAFSDCKKLSEENKHIESVELCNQILTDLKNENVEEKDKDRKIFF